MIFNVSRPCRGLILGCVLLGWVGGVVPLAWSQARLTLRGSEPAASAPVPESRPAVDPAKNNPMDALDDKKPIAVGNLLEFRVLEDFG